MLNLNGEYEKRYNLLKKRVEDEVMDDTVKEFIALDKLLNELKANGFESMIKLDPYFGEISLPYKEQVELLIKNYSEEFQFFYELLKELQDEMELHFELTEMYEDDEFEQFEEDIRVIKARYMNLLKKEHMDKLESFAKKLIDNSIQKQA